MGDLRRWSDTARGICGGMRERGEFTENEVREIVNCSWHYVVQNYESHLVQEICVLCNPKFNYLGNKSLRFLELDKSNANLRILCTLGSFLQGADKSLARIDNSYVKIKHICCLSSL